MSANKSVHKLPRFIELEIKGSSEIGFISISEYPINLPFEIKRVYWTYSTPENIVRGNHAHINLEQVIVAVSGKIIFYLESKNGEKMKFLLDNPKKALYIPEGYWRTIKFVDNAVLLCLASKPYSEKDYIRNYSYFKTI